MQMALERTGDILNGLCNVLDTLKKERYGCFVALTLHSFLSDLHFSYKSPPEWGFFFDTITIETV